MAVQQITHKKITKFDTSNPNYQEKPKVPEKKKLGGRTDGTAGSYVEKPQPKPNM